MDHEISNGGRTKNELTTDSTQDFKACFKKKNHLSLGNLEVLSD